MVDRDELARDFALALAQGYGFNEDVASRGVVLADALLAALAPPAAAPVAGRMGVGDVVRVGEYEIVLVDFTENVAIRKAWILTQPSWSNQPIPRFDSWGACWPSPVVRLRPATPAERAAAGLSVEPVAAPVEAKRPTHVRVTGPSNVTHVTVGKVYKVTEWLAGEHPRPRIVNDDGDVWNLSTADEYGGAYMPKWEPCPPPSPEAPDARGEALKALLAYAECSATWHYSGVVDESYRTVMNRHGLLDEDAPSEFVRSLLKRALALSRPAATKGGA